MEIFKQLRNNTPVQRLTMSFDHIHLTFDERGISGVSEHMEEVEAITNATENDTIFIHTRGCPGGSMDTLLVFANLLMNTPAKTVAVIEGYNASAATMLPLLCQFHEVTPYAGFMCHTAQSGEWGAVGNVERAAVFNAQRCHEFLEDIYEGFLTKEEIQKLKDGSELYLNTEAIQERLEKRKKIMMCDVTEEQPESPCGLCQECLIEAESLKRVEEIMNSPPVKKAPAKKQASPAKKAAKA
jgi:ATP-dependent protease ClpP protease subunit